MLGYKTYLIIVHGVLAQTFHSLASLMWFVRHDGRRMF